MTIKMQITIAFSIILSIIISTFYLGMQSITKLEQAYERHVEPSSKIMLLGSRMNQELLQHSLSNIKLSYAQETNQQTYLIQSKHVNDSIIAKYQLLISMVDSEGIKLLEKFKSAWDSYFAKIKKLQTKVLGNDNNNLRSIINDAGKDLDKSQSFIRLLVDKNEKEMTEIEMLFKQEYSNKKDRYIIISSVLIVMTLILLLLISRRLDNSIKFIHEYTRKLASGDYSQKIAMKGNDEITEIIEALNTIPAAQGIMMDNLNQQLKDMLSILNTTDNNNKIDTLKGNLNNLITKLDEQLKN